MALQKLLYVLLIVCICNCRIIIALSAGEFQQDIDLKLINKPAIKTIKLDYGIFDCVDIYKQPAFDHPLLKNHKIQMKPTNFLDRFDERGGLSDDEYGTLIDCPIGSVPIRRTTKEAQIRKKGLGNIKAYNHPNGGATTPQNHFALMEIKQNEGYQITGAKAQIGIFNPDVNLGEASAALILITETSDDGSYDSLSAGWQVDYSLYEDGRTYFTAAWSGKNGSGCYNLYCPGFVQVPSSMPLGSVMSDISNDTLYNRLTWIYQDQVTKNWWLVAGEQETPIGYWPKELFTSLDDGAKTLAYGGYTQSIPDETMGPPMGSGIFDKCREDSDGFFYKLMYQINDEVLKGDYIPPRRYQSIEAFSDCPNYKVEFMCNYRENWDFYFLYGGPRGECVNNP